MLDDYFPALSGAVVILLVHQFPALGSSEELLIKFLYAGGGAVFKRFL